MGTPYQFFTQMHCIFQVVIFNFNALSKTVEL